MSAPCAAADEPSTQREQRLCDLALGVLALLFTASVWPLLSASPLQLDDQALLESFVAAPARSIWAYDHFGHLRPLKNLFFFGLSRRPDMLWVFRAISLLCALLCAWLMRALAGRRWARPRAALLATALWLFNPSTLTGVAWLATANYLFALLGVLVYLLALERARQPNEPGQRSGMLVWAGQLALLAAVLSHELALLAPLWWLLRGAKHRAPSAGPRSRARGSIGVALGAALVLGVWLALRLSQPAPELAYRAGRLPALQLWTAAPLHLARNLCLWFFPQAGFGVLLRPSVPAPLPVIATGWVVLLLVAALGARLARRDAPLADALAWLALFLLPVVDLIPLGNTPVAMHYLIIPGVGLAWALVRAFDRLAARWRPHAARIATVASALVLLAWQPAFRHGVRAYCDEQTLYEATLHNDPDNIEARVDLIALLLRDKRWTEAQRWLDASLERAPDVPALLQNQLSLLTQTGRLREALAWLDAHPNWARAEPELALQRALLLVRTGREAEAEGLFQQLLTSTTRPQIRLQAGYQLANRWVQRGRLSDAHALLQRLRAEFPDSAEVRIALELLEAVLREQGRAR